MKWLGPVDLRVSARISAAVAGVIRSRAVDSEWRGRGMRISSSSVRVRLMLRAKRRLLRGGGLAFLLMKSFGSFLPHGPARAYFSTVALSSSSSGDMCDWDRYVCMDDITCWRCASWLSRWREKEVWGMR